MRLGIYSGTFDPVHEGHLAFVNYSIENDLVDKVLLLIEEKPRQKKPKANFKQRLEMAKLVSNEQIIIDEKLSSQLTKPHQLSDIEIIQKSYKNTDFSMLVGADVFLNIKNWPEIDNYKNQIKFIVALRTEDDGEEIITQDFSDFKYKIITTDKSTIRASDIRRDLDKAINKKWLNQDVANYIADNNIY